MVCFIMISSFLQAKINNHEISLNNEINSTASSDSLIIKKENVHKTNVFINEAKIYVANGAFIYDSLKVTNAIIYKIDISKKEKKIAKKENPIKKQINKKLIKTSSHLFCYNSLNNENKFQSLNNSKTTLFFQSQTPQYSKSIINNNAFSWAKYVCIKQGNIIHYNSPHVFNVHFKGRLSVRPPTYFC